MLRGFICKSLNLGQERYRKALLTSLMNVVSQVVQLVTGLVSIPLTLNYVGVERFGIWMTLSTALAFITFSDFGVGIGLQDRMSKFIGSGNYESARKAFFSSFLFILILFVLLICVSNALILQVNISLFFALQSSEAIKEIVPTTEMVIFVFGLGLLGGLVQRAFNALQEGFWVAAIQVVARFVSLALLFLVVHLKMGLPALVLVVGGVSSLALLLVGIPVLFIRNKWMLPKAGLSIKVLDWVCLKGILKIGTLGLGASVAIYFVNNSIPFLMAKKYGIENVADYSVLLKLVSIPGMFLTYLFLPLWPAITEAKVKHDNMWIIKTYKRCSILVFGFTAVCVAVFLFFGREIILLWTQNESVVPGFELLLASVVFMALGFWNSLTSVILNGLSRFKSQATYGIFLATIFVTIAAFVPNSYGKESIVWVVAAGYLIRCIIMQLEVTLILRSNRKLFV